MALPYRVVCKNCSKNISWISSLSQRLNVWKLAVEAFHSMEANIINTSIIISLYASIKEEDIFLQT